MKKLLKSNSSLIIPLVLLVISVLYFSRLFYPTLSVFTTPDFGLSEPFAYTYPMKKLLVESYANGTVPLWSPYFGSGSPIYSEGYYFLFNQILFRLFDTIAAINLSFIVSFFIASFGSYLFLRQQKLSRLASAYGGLTFAFSGPLVMQITHFSVVQSIAILPWLLVFVHEFIKGGRLLVWLFLVVIVSQQIFLGFPQVVLISMFVALGYATYLNLYSKKFFLLIKIIAAFALGAVLSSVQLLPSIELLNFSNRQGGLGNSATAFSYPWIHLKTLLWPFSLGDPRLGTYPFFANFDGSIFWENTGYIGAFSLALAIFGAIYRPMRQKANFFIILAVMSLLLMTGKHSPLYFLFNFPPFDFFRVPSRFIILFVFALSTLAGFGLDHLIALLSSHLSKTRLQYFSLFITGLSFCQLFFFSFNYHPVGPAKVWLPSRSHVASLKQTTARYLTYGAGEVWNREYNQSGWKEMDHYRLLLNFMQPNFNLWYKFASFDFYHALPTRRQLLLDSLVKSGIRQSNNSIEITGQSRKLLALYSVDTILASSPVSGAKIEKIPLYGDNELIISKLDSLPEARLVYEVKIAHSIDQLLKLIGETNLEKTAIVEEFLFINQNQNNKGIVKEISHKDQSALFEVETSAQTLLVWNQSFYPGWQATINGKKAEIIPANINSQAILLPKGQSKVEFQYQPKSFALGARISLISHLIVLSVMFLGLFQARAAFFSKYLPLSRRQNKLHKDR